MPVFLNRTPGEAEGVFKIMEFGILRTISWFIKFTTHPSVPLPAFVSRAATDQRNPEEPQEGHPRVPRCIPPGIKCSGTCNGGAHAPLQTRVRQAGRRTQTLGQSRSQERELGTVPGPRRPAPARDGQASPCCFSGVCWEGGCASGGPRCPADDTCWAPRVPVLL